MLDKNKKFENVTAMDAMKMGQYVNPELAHSSDYFKKLDALMQCVSNNADLASPGNEAVQDRVCGKEFKDLRLSAFKSSLLYHNVNARLFQHELQYTKGFSEF